MDGWQHCGVQLNTESLPVLCCCALQIVMSAHKEQALDESRYHFRFGSTCVTGFGDAIHTSRFDTFDDFFAHLQQAWDKLWLEVFSAEPAGVGAAWEREVVTCTMYGGRDTNSQRWHLALTPLLLPRDLAVMA
jgi:hypothetical protein